LYGNPFSVFSREKRREEEMDRIVGNMLAIVGRCCGYELQDLRWMNIKEECGAVMTLGCRVQGH
jgi:hypothetical protein